MTSAEIEAIQNYVSVGASTVRGLRTKGVVAAARAALKEVELRPYAARSIKHFVEQLDFDTQQLLSKLPKGARHWGVARKVLNIFLRGALYNTYLHEHYKLGKLEEAYEIPLDSLSAGGIREFTLASPKPRWVGVKHVTPTINLEFQRLAMAIAAERNTQRVHLDAVFWGGR